MFRNLFAATTILFAGVAVPGIVAAENGKVTLEMKSFQEIESKDKAGKVTKKQVPVTRAVPGGEIVYVIQYSNKGAQPADQVVITNPVPGPVEFRAGTATSKGATDAVSVDGGKTYGKLETLKVTGTDGKPRAATGADVTHVQWKLLAPVKPGATGSVGYRVVIE